MVEEKEYIVNPIIKKDGLHKLKFNHSDLDEGNLCHECEKKIDMSKPHIAISVELETCKENEETISVEILDSQCRHIFCNEDCYEKYGLKILNLLYPEEEDGKSEKASD